MSDPNPKVSTLHCLQQGNGPALVLLHAFPVDARMWQGQLADLSSRFRVIAPDFGGFGQSPLAGPFTVGSMADDIHQLLHGLGAPPCVLAGISMGGYVAMQIARKYPQDLRGLILVDTKDTADTAEQRENRTRMIEVARTRGSTAVADLMFPKMLSPDTVDHRPEQARFLRQMMESCPAPTIEHALAALRDRPDMSEELPKIATPTLIVVGDADSITPISVAEAMQRKIPGAKLAVINGAGHMSPLEQPSQVNRAIRQLIDAL